MSETIKHKLLNDRNLQIGNICFQLSHLEFLLMLTVRSLVRVDEATGKILCAGRNIQSRLNLAIALSKHLNAPHEAFEALNTLRDKLQKNKLLERRNKAIHGHRLLDPEDPSNELVEVSSGKGKNQKVPQSNDDLAKLGKEIADAHKQFHASMISSGVFTACCAKPNIIE